MKQSKLPFKATKKSKDKGSDSEGSEVDINFESLSPPPIARGAPRRAAAGIAFFYLL